MPRFLIHGAVMMTGLVIGLTLLNALSDYLAELTGSDLLASAMVLGPLIAAVAVLGWQVYGPAKHSTPSGQE